MKWEDRGWKRRDDLEFGQSLTEAEIWIEEIERVIEDLYINETLQGPERTSHSISWNDALDALCDKMDDFMKDKVDKP